MNPQDWKDIEQALGHPYRHVRLLADGHELTLAVERGKGLRYVVAVYIDNKIEWGKTVRPEADAVERKFWRCKRTFLYGPKVRARAAEMAKKRGTKPAEVSFEMLDPTFPGAKAACSHLRKHCTAVERLPADILDALDAAQ